MVEKEYSHHHYHRHQLAQPFAAESHECFSLCKVFDYHHHDQQQQQQQQQLELIFHWHRFIALLFALKKKMAEDEKDEEEEITEAHQFGSASASQPASGCSKRGGSLRSPQRNSVRPVHQVKWCNKSSDDSSPNCSSQVEFRRGGRKG